MKQTGQEQIDLVAGLNGNQRWTLLIAAMLASANKGAGALMLWQDSEGYHAILGQSGGPPQPTLEGALIKSLELVTGLKIDVRIPALESLAALRGMVEKFGRKE